MSKKRIEYYPGVNWATSLVDIVIILSVVYSMNYWLLFLLMFTGDYQIKKYGK